MSMVQWIHIMHHQVMEARISLVKILYKDLPIFFMYILSLFLYILFIIMLIMLETVLHHLPDIALLLLRVFPACTVICSKTHICGMNKVSVRWLTH